MAKGDRQNVQSGLDDILGSVIKTDRRNSGRKVEDAPAAPSISAESPEDRADRADRADPIAVSGGGEDRTSDKPPAPEIMTSVNEIKQPYNNTLTQYDNNTLTQEAAETTEKPEDSEDPEESLVQRRYREAITLAASPTTTVTLRVPHALNDWMDEYLHGAWPEKIKKQELLIEALQLLYVRRGRPKEEILETELMPRSKK